MANQNELSPMIKVDKLKLLTYQPPNVVIVDVISPVAA